MHVRQVTEQDLKAIERLEISVWGDEAANIDLIYSRFEIFPEGSLVVEDKGEIVGYSAIQRVKRICSDDWFEQTDNGYIKHSHDDQGHIIYGIGMSGTKHGVSELLINYVYDTFIASGMCYLIALGSRLPGFKEWSKRTNKGIKDYIKTRKVDGLSIDPELRLYQKHGFEVLFEIPDYFPCQDSNNYGAMIIKK
ncbi:hypothetical protein [Ferrimonas aestuarii]|uniref:N-acetyltransferase domain-containing protein n=1 Tax=Ferrimonas aestuarii TaxID=2569539 RepID=A0A4U1BS24_9GAMM|nr:hypothetical protein [Ferrimonas aestuarii]TKB56132.1 hypothetical protein FCL42_07915 [Ferrimonas aestuarii]